MTEETPLRPRAAYADVADGESRDGHGGVRPVPPGVDAPREPADPEFMAENLGDCRELLRRAAEYADAQGDATIAAELRRGAAVLNSEVRDAE